MGFAFGGWGGIGLKAGLGLGFLARLRTLSPVPTLPRPLAEASGK